LVSLIASGQLTAEGARALADAGFLLALANRTEAATTSSALRS
jgi:hypothetical protein